MLFSVTLFTMFMFLSGTEHINQHFCFQLNVNVSYRCGLVIINTMLQQTLYYTMQFNQSIQHKASRYVKTMRAEYDYFCW